MKCTRLINVIDSHTAGEPTRVITGGINIIPGKNMADKMHHMKYSMDMLRTLLMQEPRGHRDMFGAILTEPISPEADLGVIFMNAGGYLSMCGHGSIGAITVAVEIGLINAVEPITQLVLDTPSGLVKARAMVENGSVKSVTIENVPSFLYMHQCPVIVPELGNIKVDIAYGGNFFALISASDLGLVINKSKSTELIDFGLKIRTAVNDQVEVVHPYYPHLKSVDLVEIYENRSLTRAVNAVVFGEGSLDRSPCGTGTSAKLALDYYLGKIAPGVEYSNESIIGTVMGGQIIKETNICKFKAIITEITARAYITGFSQMVLDPEDPLGFGFLLY